MRRNALVALGNTADLDDCEVDATLTRYESGPDPLLREHAAWARRSLSVKRRCATSL